MTSHGERDERRLLPRGRCTGPRPAGTTEGRQVGHVGSVERGRPWWHRRGQPAASVGEAEGRTDDRGATSDGRPRCPLPVMAAALVGCSTQEQPAPAPASGVAKSLNQEFGAVVEDVLPSVVEITHDGAVGSGIVFDNQGQHRHQRPRRRHGPASRSPSPTATPPEGDAGDAYPDQDLAVFLLAGHQRPRPGPLRPVPGARSARSPSPWAARSA